MVMMAINILGLLCFKAVVFLILTLALTTHSAPDISLVTTLPGFNGTFPSKHFSGYVSIDPRKNLFYYFVESERNPSEDPVVLWLNGGPGFSSFDGFVYEHGPFNFVAAKHQNELPKLKLNQYSWSKVSNIIYLDSPAGVGFSYSSDTSDYITNDTQTASDSHTFLLKWFGLYPEFLNNPFFISGESYAGVYVPMLASEVVKGIDSGVKPILNFKGYLIGNGVCDDKFDNYNAAVPFSHGMGLISDELYQEAYRACNGSFNDYYEAQSESCHEKFDEILEDLDGLNIYNILEPCYYPNSSFWKTGKANKPLAEMKRSWPFRAPVKPGIVPTWPQLFNAIGVPCINDEVAILWLNDPEVREAIHAEPASLIGPWMMCTENISYYHNAGSMIVFHKNLTTRGYRALIYSGDHDMRVPFTGTEAWTRSIGYKVVDKWRHWIIKDNQNYQIAGYLQGYENNFTFLTVKGAGHTVPESKPHESLVFYSRFLAGQVI